MTAHHFQHADYPTWCIRCGRFAEWCKGDDCTGDDMNRFDSRVSENFDRMVDDLFGSLPSVRDDED